MMPPFSVRSLDNSFVDAERLAALLDGRLSSADAAAVRQALSAADDDALAAYADAIAIAQELSAESTAVVPLRRRRWMIPAVAAAAIVVLIPILWQLRARQSAVHGPAQYAALVPAGVALPATDIWGATRGASVASGQAIAVRAGALVVDLGVALQRGAATTAIVSALADDLSPVSGATAVVANLRAIAAHGGAAAFSYEPLAASILTSVDSELGTAGAWLEAVRLTHAAGVTMLTERAPAAAVLAPLARRTDLSEQQRASIELLLALTGKTSRQSPEIHDAAESLLRRLGR
jgi:hypothetical protein